MKMKKKIISVISAVAMMSALIIPTCVAESVTVGSENFENFSVTELGKNPRQKGTNNTFYKGSSGNDDNMSALIDGDDANKYLHVKLSAPESGNPGKIQYYIRPGDNEKATLESDIIKVSYKLKINSLGGEVEVGTLSGNCTTTRSRGELIRVKSDGTLKISGNGTYNTVLDSVGTDWHTLSFTIYKDDCTFDVSVDGEEKLSAAKLCYDGRKGEMTTAVTNFNCIYFHSENTAVDVCYDDILFETEAKAFALTASTPADNATDVAVTSDVELSFNRAVLESTIDGNITISPEVSFTPSVSSDGKTVTLSFDEPLAKKTKYTVTVSSGIKDADGEALAADTEFSFTTTKKDKNYIGGEDFEGYTLTDGEAAVNNSSSDIFITQSSSKKNFTVKAEEDGNKYLCMNKTSSEKIDFSIYGGKSSGAKLTDPVISYKYRMKINSFDDGGSHFGSVYGSYVKADGTNVQNNYLIKIYKDGNSLKFCGEDGTAGENGAEPDKHKLLSVNTIDGKWHEYEIILNRIDMTWTLKLDGDIYCKDMKLCGNGNIEYKSIASVDRIYFTNSTQAIDAALDDIEFSKVDCLEVTSVTPSDMTAVPLEATIVVGFNKPVAEASVTAKIVRDSDNAETSNTATLGADGKTLTVKASGLDYKTGYTLTLSGLKSDEEISVPLVEDYKISFVTKPRKLDVTSVSVTADGAAVTNMSQANGKKIKVAVNVKNYEYTDADGKSYEVIAALKTKDGETIDIVSEPWTLALGADHTSETLELDVPQTGEYTVEVFCWESIESGVPLVEKISF